MKKNIILLHSMLSIIGLLITTNLSGQSTIEWEKLYGGSANDEAQFIQETLDGGYIIGGTSNSNDGDVGINRGLADIWIVKLDEVGDFEWGQNYGGSEVDVISMIIETSDGGYALAASTYSEDWDIGNNNGELDYWILKLDDKGELEWEQNYGGSGLDLCSSILETSDGGYMLGGTGDTSNGDVGGNHGDRDVWIVKLDGSGNIEWEQNYGGSGFDAATSIQKTAEGGYIILGDSYSNDLDVGGNNGIRDCWIIKIDDTGNIEWEQNYGSFGLEQAQSMQLTKDGGYVVLSAINNGSGDDWDYWVFKLNEIGILLWQKRYGGSGHDVPTAIQQTSDNGYLIGGYSRSNDGDVSGNFGNFDYWIVKLNSNGDLEWEQNYGGFANDTCRDLILTKDGGYVAAGGSNSEMWILKFSPLEVSVPEIIYNQNFKVSPNPSNGLFTIDIKNVNSPMNVKIIDALGKCIYEKDVSSMPTTIQNISQGHYTILVTSGDKTYSQKIISF